MEIWKISSSACIIYITNDRPCRTSHKDRFTLDQMETDYQMIKDFPG